MTDVTHESRGMNMVVYETKKKSGFKIVKSEAKDEPVEKEKKIVFLLFGFL